MDIKFDKDSAGGPQTAGDNKGKQNILLVVIIVLVGVFAYTYFFTGLIKPMPGQKVAEVPAAAQMARKPLPTSEGAPPKVVTGEAKKDTAVPVKPEPAPAAPIAVATAPVTPAKPVVKEAAKPKEGLKVAVESQSGDKKPLPATGKAVAEKPVPVGKKQTVVAENKPQTAKGVEKKPADMKKPVEKQIAAVTAVAKTNNVQQKQARKAAASASVAGSVPWTVLIGNYVLEDAMATDLARVRKAGLEAFVVPGAKKNTHMNRLLLAEFTDRETAQEELAKLKRLTSDAFMIDYAGKHVVYAGSYLRDAWAVAEKERLAAAGFKLTVKRVVVAIPSKNLTAGTFAEKSAAENVLKKLRAAEVKATLSRH